MNNQQKSDLLKVFVNIVVEYRLSDNQTEASFKEMMKKWSSCWSDLINTKGLAEYTDFLCDSHIKKQMGYLHRFNMLERERWNPTPNSPHFPYMKPEVYSQPTDTI
jgi:hypothetical protein